MYLLLYTSVENNVNWTETQCGIDVNLPPYWILSVHMFKSREQSIKQKQKTHKAGRIVIFHCLGIAKRFKDGIGLQELAFQLTLWRKTER